MTDAPHLSQHDIVQQLEELYRTTRKHHLVAFFGTGTEEVVSTTAAGRFQVVRTRSELELRERMPPLGSDDRMAFLVPWPTTIPLDLAGRFARGGKVMRIGRDARLRRLFGVTIVDGDARSCPLGDYLLRPGQAQRYALAGGRLTLDAMWAAWLGSDWDVPVEGGLALDALLGWAAVDARGGRFADAMAADEASGVREALLAYLADRLGPAGPIVWSAWEKGQAQSVLELGLLFDPLTKSSSDVVQFWVKNEVRTELGVEEQEAALALARGLGAVAASALRYVESQGEAAAVRAILQAADARVKDQEVRVELISDSRLPSAFGLRLDALGELLQQAAAAPTAAVVAETRELLGRVEVHELARHDEQLRVLKRAEMAARLVAWLASRAGQEPDPGTVPYADVMLLASQYAEEGGYIDWARHWARGKSDDRFDAGVQAVVQAADAVRLELDRRFAKALAAWVVAGRPASEVLPIDKAVRRIAIEFVKQQSDRKLLILLLDGMAWAQGVELLSCLGSRAAPWGPIAWHASKQGRIGEGIYPVVLAGLPTTTEVSRSAFFAGKPMPPGKKPATQKDRDRWRDNPELGKLFPDDVAPLLLLGGESHTADGSVSKQALSLIEDAERPVVAIIINTIDASLGGDKQQRHAWTPESIASLPDLLDKARECGRTVLLASDHGHVPADVLENKAPLADGGGRWRSWSSPDEPVADFEVGIAGSGVWTPKGAHGVVLLADDQAKYGPVASAGEHGGATLAEVVAPCLLIGCDEGAALQSDDPALAVRPAHVPPWWHLDVLEPKPELPDEPAPPPKPKRTKAVDDRQISLPVVTEPKPEPVKVAASAAKRPSLAPPPIDDGALAAVAPLADSDLFKARLKGAKIRPDDVLRAVAYLVDHQGVASGAAFASAVGKLQFQAASYVSVLGEVLNVDAYQVIVFDPSSRQVRLDSEKLRLLFEVKVS